MGHAILGRVYDNLRGLPHAWLVGTVEPAHPAMKYRPPVCAFPCLLPAPAHYRDPRWGRQSETYGEDPLLASTMANAFVRGLQGGDGRGEYLKVSATCKHLIGNDLGGLVGAARMLREHRERNDA